MKKSHKYLSIAILGTLLGVTVLFLDFVNGIKAFRSIGNGADAIVVLTGGKGRTDEGLTLLRKGKAQVLILSGVHEDADHDAIFLNRINKVERSRIVLEKRSRSTYENAVEVKRLMEEKGLKSMVLITSGYHIKRADFIFRHIMPPDIRIEAYSVSTPNFDDKKWWSGRGLGILAAEFLKYYWYAGRFALEGALG